CVAALLPSRTSFGPRALQKVEHLLGETICNLPGSLKIHRRSTQVESSIEVVRRFCAAWADEYRDGDCHAGTDDAVCHDIPRRWSRAESPDGISLPPLAARVVPRRETFPHASGWTTS